jgi:hypothetical protein
MAASYVSGDVVKAVGFSGFFGIVCLASIPGMLTLRFIPLREEPAARPLDGALVRAADRREIGDER